jgi:predicted adenylyl cyclase CyaB
MNIIIKEIKAYCKTPELVEEYLLSKKADFKGIDMQEDTYFNVNQGRLKLRIGSTEQNLIYYDRTEVQGMKHSDVKLYPQPKDPETLKQTLSLSLGILTQVRKERKIYFIENVKFHIDTVEHLGSFVEIEAIGAYGEVQEDLLSSQCQYYINELGISKEDMIDQSYSDMIMDKKKEVRSNQRTS